MPAKAVLLFKDQTIIRLCLGLRRAWAFSGEQAGNGINVHNDRRVLFGTINMHTGHHIVEQYRDMGQESFQAFLQLLRRNYRHRSIWLILDKAGCHTTGKSRQLAKALDIKLIWLPRQCPELNAMDHLWRHLKRDVSANHQYKSIEEHVQIAREYVLQMTKQEVLRKAGILSENFWLKSFIK
jgi:transposase